MLRSRRLPLPTPPTSFTHVTGFTHAKKRRHGRIALRRLQVLQHLSRLLTTRRGVLSRRRALVRDHGLREATGSQQLQPIEIAVLLRDALLVLLRFLARRFGFIFDLARAGRAVHAQSSRLIDGLGLFLVLARVDRHDAASAKMTTGMAPRRNCPEKSRKGAAAELLIVAFVLQCMNANPSFVGYDIVVVRRCDACKCALYAHLAALRYWRYCSRRRSSIFSCPRRRYSLSSLHFGTGQLSSMHCLE